MRTRNFRARNEKSGKRSSNQESKTEKSQRGEESGRMLSVESRWTMLCSFRHDPASGNRCEAQRQKGQSSSPAPKAQAKTDGKIPSKGSGRRREFRAEISLGKNVRTRHVIIGTLPRVNITSLRQDAGMATNAISDMLRRRRSPAKNQRKVVRKDQLLY